MKERRVFESISNFTKANCVKIKFEYDCVGNLTITMSRGKHSISRTIDHFYFMWLADSEDAVFFHLNAMLGKIIESEGHE
jgi:hypothetical protein